MMAPDTERLMIRNEDIRLSAYLDSGGVWTIGLGHIVGVKKGDTCTQDEAMDWFAQEWSAFQRSVSALVRAETAQRELDAMTSLAYNIGKAGFASSTVLRRHNAGDRPGAAAAFSMWNKDNGRIVQGLVNRRKREAAFYLGLPWDYLP